VSCVFGCNCVFEYFVDSVPDHAAQIWYTCSLGRVLKQEETSINARRLLLLSAAVHGMILCEKEADQKLSGNQDKVQIGISIAATPRKKCHKSQP
jgi:hypothetical protein